MKICYLADAPCIHTRRWVDYFAAKGHKVSIISFRPGNFSPEIEVHILRHSFKINQKGGNYFYLLYLPELRRLVYRLRPHILHAHFVTSYGFLGACLGYHPFFVTAHGTDILITPKRSMLHRACTRLALERADVVNSVSPEISHEILRIAKVKNLVTQQYGIDLAGFSTAIGATRDYRQFNYHLISTRRLAANYNVEILIRAVAVLRLQIPDLRVLVLGDGHKRGYLEKLVQKLQVAKHIVFLGEVKPPQVLDYLRLSLIYCSTSPSDGTSLSLLEAMACGAFPIVTDIPANQRWIRDGENGFLVSPNDMTALIDRFLRAFRNLDLLRRAGKKNWEIVSKMENFAESMATMERLYQKALNGETATTEANGLL